VILFCLLVIALACIVVGVVTAAGPWFIGSLVASALAGIMLWQERNRTRREAAGATPRDPAPGPPAGSPAGTADDAPAEPLAADEVWVVDGRPRYHLQGCATIAGQPAEQISLAQAKQDGFIACSLCAPTTAVK
jgi:hypothetical protein